MILQSMFKNATVLAVFALVSVGLTSLTYLMTRDKIQSEREQAVYKALTEIIPEDQFDNDPYRDCIEVTDPELLGTSEPQLAWRLRQSGTPVGVVITSVAPNGYSGAIHLLVGHYTDGRIAGARVTEHKETPGLGDKVERQKSDWILSFTNLATETLKPEDWQVKKDGGQFDAFTGATITPRAVVSAVKRNHDYFRAHKQMLFDGPANCHADEESEN